MTARVVTIGNAMVDVVARVPHLPERGGDVLARGGRIEVGGGGFRTLLAARAAGAQAVARGAAPLEAASEANAAAAAAVAAAR